MNDFVLRFRAEQKLAHHGKNMKKFDGWATHTIDCCWRYWTWTNIRGPQKKGLEFPPRQLLSLFSLLISVQIVDCRRGNWLLFLQLTAEHAKTHLVLKRLSGMLLLLLSSHRQMRIDNATRGKLIRNCRRRH